MHCPRCGAAATVNQQFCRSCGLHLEKVSELLGEQALTAPSDEVKQLRARQQRIEHWAGIAGLVTFGLILVLLIGLVVSQMIVKAGAVLPGILLILLVLGAAIMAAFQGYSKSLKSRLEQAPLPQPPDRLEAERSLESHRVPISSITEGTTELLELKKAPDTGRIDD